MVYENQTYEAIMARCLARVPTSYDTREGSVIFNALAPAVAEMAQLYIELEGLMDRAFPDTATGDDLTMKASERGVLRAPATYAVRKGVFTDSSGSPMAISAGTRFTGGTANYVVGSETAPGEYELTAETAGVIGNLWTGTLLPVDYVSGLGSCTLTDVLIPGEDEESDAELRARYTASLSLQAFGGNVQDYREKVGAMDGVGGVRVYPTWNGGGTVKLAILDSSWGVPSQTLVDAVQDAVDPTSSQGSGMGIAPVGHVVTVVGAVAQAIDVSASLSIQSGFAQETVEANIRTAIEAYFVELSQGFSDDTYLIVYGSRVETCMLDVPGVLSVDSTTLSVDGAPSSNVILSGDEIPALGTLTITLL